MSASAASSPWRDRLGEVVAIEDVAVPRARVTADLLAARDDLGATLVEVRQTAEGTWLLLDVDVDVGQRPIEDIRAKEPLAIGFGIADENWPTVWALREDFPRRLPHAYQATAGRAAVLCVSEIPWVEARRKWTPSAMIALVRRWLIDTAEGILHRDEQALLPFLAGSGGSIILPAEIVADPSKSYSVLTMSEEGDAHRALYRVIGSDQKASEAPSLTVAGCLDLPAQAHGAINFPETLGEFRALLGDDADTFDRDFAKVVRGWLAAKHHDAKPILILQVPLERRSGSGTERYDRIAMRIEASVRQLGEALNLWSSKQGAEGPILEVSFLRLSRSGESDGFGLKLLNPHVEMHPEYAARLNGYDEPTGKRIVVIGAGALGSQILANLFRMGEAIIAVVDEDRLLPHNLARHAVTDRGLLGNNKAVLACILRDELMVRTHPLEAINVDVTRPCGPDAAKYLEALATADIVIDATASVSAARSLSTQPNAPGRRVSVFLSPTGRDLVILAEDGDRRTTLEQLEQNYYAALIADPRLDGHLDLAPGVRYARSCREVSAAVPQAFVAAHSALAAEALRRIALNDSPLAAVWRLSPYNLTLSRVDIDTRPARQAVVGGWTVFVTEALVDHMTSARSAALPAETGGALVGDFDFQTRRAYVIAALAPPRDSKGDPGSFVRGAAGLDGELARIDKRTLSMARYVGEWHSHPPGSRAVQSELDRRAYAFMSAAMAEDGLPVAMLIAAEHEIALVFEGEQVAVPAAGPAVPEEG